MRTLCLALLLTACASPRRGAYRQSAAPMAPAFNPMTDSPHTVGQPGYIGAPEPVPRSPHKRVLPPTKEPGLWAGDTKASATDGTGVTVRLYLAWMPFDVLAVSEADISAKVAKSCANDMNQRLAQDPVLNSLVTRLVDADRGCLAATVYLACVTGQRDAAMKARGIDGTDDGSTVMYGLNMAKGFAEHMHAIACAGGELSPFGDAARDRWLKSPFKTWRPN